MKAATPGRIGMRSPSGHGPLLLTLAEIAARHLVHRSAWPVYGGLCRTTDLAAKPLTIP